MGFTDSLSDEDLELLANTVDDTFIVSLRTKPIQEVRELARKIDAFFIKAPLTEGPVIIYRMYQGQGVKDYLEGGELIEGAYLVGSLERPGEVPLNTVVLEILVPGGIPVLEFDGEDGERVLILPRGVKLDIEESEGDMANATILGVENKGL